MTKETREGEREKGQQRKYGGTGDVQAGVTRDAVGRDAVSKRKWWMIPKGEAETGSARSDPGQRQR